MYKILTFSILLFLNTINNNSNPNKIKTINEEAVKEKLEKIAIENIRSLEPPFYEVKMIESFVQKDDFLVFIDTATTPELLLRTEVENNIDSLMNTYYRNGLFNGVVLVSKRGQILYKKAFGIADREWNIPMTIDTKFKIGSISKPFTALIILQLVNEGQIRLDGTIADYIPDYNGEHKDRVSIHHLLTHTSGILNSLQPDEEAIKERLHHNLRDLIKYAEETELYFDPGSNFHYSNFGYNILAYIAEKVTGKTFDTLLKEKIFEPAGMMDTKQYSDVQIEERLAKGYEYKLLNGYENAMYFDNSYAVGSGGLISTAEDLFKWHQALLTDQFISKELKAMLYEPTEQGQYGYGWGVSKKIFNSISDTLNIADHSGSVNGFGSYIAHILNDSSLVVVLKNNRDDTYISPAYAPNIGQDIISVLYGENVALPKKSIAKHMAYHLGRFGFDMAKNEYFEIKSHDFESYSFEESELNQLGIELFFRFNMPDEALKIFELNMIEFPKSYNTYDSYAYILMQKKEYASAINYYRQGLEMLQMYPEVNDSEQVHKDAKKALEYIEEMEEKLHQ
jgi:CubicO group peptidase (beta-lactamase class C family)